MLKYLLSASIDISITYHKLSVTNGYTSGLWAFFITDFNQGSFSLYFSSPSDTSTVDISLDVHPTFNPSWSFGYNESIATSTQTVTLTSTPSKVTFSFPGLVFNDVDILKGGSVDGDSDYSYFLQIRTSAPVKWAFAPITSLYAHGIVVGYEYWGWSVVYWDGVSTWPSIEMTSGLTAFLDFTNDCPE